MKERTSAFLYAAGVLHEGLAVAESLAKHFRDLRQFREGFAPILADPDVQALRSRYLKPLRDKAVFHFDRDVAATALPRLSAAKDVVVLSGGEPNAAGVYFNLADDVTLHFLVGEYTDEAKFMAELEVFMVATGKLFKRFTIGAQRVLPAAFRELGVRPEPRRRRG